VIVSDRSIRDQLAARRIVIDPLTRPSSIDVRISHLFRLFRNHTVGVMVLPRIRVASRGSNH
jgi:dCTP deaminase